MGSLTPTIIRIKRLLGDESSESIIVSSKRQRISKEDDSETSVPDVCTAILKKLATLKKDDLLEVETKKALARQPLHSWDLKENFKKGSHSSAKEIIRKQSKLNKAAVKFKLTSTKRNLSLTELEGSQSDGAFLFQLYDASKENESAPALLPTENKNTDLDVIACNGVPLESEKVEFVYDLYYTPLPIEPSSWINNICEIQYRDTVFRDTDSEEEEEYEEDENCESNWKNDYPEEKDDSDSFEYEDEYEYLCASMKKTKLIAESESSYDADDYDEDGDFDESGNILMNLPSKSVFGVMKKSQRFKFKPDDDDDSDYDS